jgi:hypothetical protein
MKINIKFLLFLIPALIIFGCEKNDFTGHSSLVPTNPTITADLGTIPTINDGANQSHKITLNMDVAQIVNVVVHISTVEGTATEGVDYKFPSSVTIPAGKKTATFEVSFLKDEEFEVTETVKIQIGDDRTANANFTPITVDYSISNFADTDLAIELSWDAVAFDQFGEQYTPIELADMILYIIDPNGDVLAEVDGASFEGFVLEGAEADGTYLIKAGFWSAMQFDEAVDITLALDYNQVGVGANGQIFEGLVTTETAELCDIEIYLAKIVKIGTVYTITEDAYLQFPLDLQSFEGTYVGLDGSIGTGYNWTYDNPIVLAMDGENLTIDSINMAWMEQSWGETVTSHNPVIIKLYNNGTLEIEEQAYMVTDYDGNPYDYSISGTGTWNSCTPHALHIEYDMYNTTDGYSLGEWLLENSYSDTNYFIANVTQGAKQANNSKSNTYKKIRR